ncbi:mechanosensitive ion channel family protein [Natronorarus salvus]|uniref:mechanosensitive ion channel family protein n=1 Tax=Natronorarus salvus TaxID=3117733 RepID=UPI002F2692BA
MFSTVVAQGFVPDLPTRYAVLLLRLAEFAVAFLILYGLGRLLLEPALDRLLDLRRVERTLASAIRRSARAGIVVVALAGGAAIAGFGYVVAGSAVMVAAVTVALGFAAQDVIANLVAGAFIVTDPKFNIDDWIEWEDKRGRIDEITFRATRIRTFDNELITVPNSQLMTTAVTNPVINDTLRLTHRFEIGYDDDLDRAMELCAAAVAEQEEALTEPEPTVLLGELGDDFVGVDVRYWIANPKRRDVLRIRSEFDRTVKEAFEGGEIELSPPSEHDVRGAVGVRDG